MEVEQIENQSTPPFSITSLTIQNGYRLYKKHVKDNPIHLRLWSRNKKYIRIILFLYFSSIIFSLITTTLGFFSNQNPTNSSFLFGVAGFSLLLHFVGIIAIPYLYASDSIRCLWNEDSLLKTTPISNETLIMGILTPVINFYFKLTLWTMPFLFITNFLAYAQIYRHEELPWYQIVFIALLLIIAVISQIFSNLIITISLLVTATYRTLFLPGKLLKNSEYTLLFYISPYFYLLFLYFLFSCFLSVILGGLGLIFLRSVNMTTHFYTLSMIASIFSSIVLSLITFYALRNAYWKQDINELGILIFASRTEDNS